MFRILCALLVMIVALIDSARAQTSTYAEAQYLKNRKIIKVEAGGDLGARFIELIFPGGEVWQVRSRKLGFVREPPRQSQRTVGLSGNSATDAVGALIITGLSQVTIDSTRSVTFGKGPPQPNVKFSEILFIPIDNEALYRRDWSKATINIWYGEPGPKGLPGAVLKSIPAPNPDISDDKPQ